MKQNTKMPVLPIQKTATIGEMLEWAKEAEGKKTTAEKKIRILKECQEKWGPMCGTCGTALEEPWRLRSTVESAHTLFSSLPHRESLSIEDVRTKKIGSNLLYLVQAFVTSSGRALHHVNERYFTMPS